MTERPNKDEYAPYYEKYINLVPEGNMIEILKNQFNDTYDLLRNVTESQGNYRYSSDKWSMKEVIGHIADTERIMSYRMLRIARGDITPIPGFEQNSYVEEALFSQRTILDLLEELSTVRRATISLLLGLTEEAWQRKGIANNLEVTVKGIAFIIAGHELHHRGILNDKYFLKI